MNVELNGIVYDLEPQEKVIGLVVESAEEIKIILKPIFFKEEKLFKEGR